MLATAALPLILLPVALLVEALCGYPKAVLRAIGHPVMWQGALIGRLDRHWNLDGAPYEDRRRAGTAALAVLLAVTGLAALVLQTALLAVPGGPVWLAIVASSLFAQRSLFEHVRAVAVGLERGGLEGGRAAVAHIVGRDPESLDAHAVARAAIESLAENFSDGVVAPVFWFAVLGLPGAALYKAINTADSMIGHRTERHDAFGFAAAKLDDFVNLPASRLSAFLIRWAAATLPGCDARAAAAAVKRDAQHHRSPNAGWPEAAMAGALGLKLAGPRLYGGVRVEDAFLGAGRSEATARDIRRALDVFARACLIQFGIALALAAVVLTLLWRA